MNATDVFAIVT